MEEEAVETLRISDLIQRSEPISGTLSLQSSRPNLPHIPQTQTRTQARTRTRTQTQTLLKTLPNPTILMGTLTLPTSDTSDICNCFRFFDDSAQPICSHILTFSPKMLAQKIKVTAWNYIPGKCGGGRGFLEIVRWEVMRFPEEFRQCGGNVDSFSMSSRWGIGEEEEGVKGKYFVYGALESVSPVTVVPCAVRSRESDGKSCYKSLCGFLVRMWICECRFCKCKDMGNALCDLGEGEDGRSRRSSHRFDKAMIVYFCGSASAWHVVITRMIGKVCLVSGLKKKLVYIGKDESELMYVTTEKGILHLPRLPRHWVGYEKINVRGKGECGCYRGTVTGSYMKGMVIELDREVMLLLTETQFRVPHGLRVGAIVSIKNVHFVNPRYPWTRVLVLGACLRTSITVESFSPFETGCYQTSHSQSLIEKFVHSLCFCARLWMLLLITTLRSKFADMLSEKDILGTRNRLIWPVARCYQKEGLAQTFANSHLPLSAFRCQNGVFMDFCKHDSCRCGGNTGCGHFKLVVPISNLLSHCKIISKQNFLLKKTRYGVLDPEKLHNSFFCGGITYYPSAKKIIHAEHLGVILLGYLKVSSSTGRLQLVDTTGKIDVAFFNLPSDWHCNRMIEIKDFNITTEGPSGNWDQKLLRDELFTCQNIFRASPPSEEMNIPFYLTFTNNNQEVIHPGPSEVNWKGNSQVFEGGTFHFLRLVHKFPVLNMFQGDQVDSNKMSVFAEAVILPWDLLLDEKNSDAHLHAHSGVRIKDTDENMVPVDIRIRRNENTEHGILKRCKIDKLMSQHANANSTDAQCGSLSSCSLPTYSCSYGRQNSCESRCPYQILCNITGKSVSKNYTGLLKCRNSKERACGSCSMHARKLLLEFNLESFCEYQALKVNDCYLLKHCLQDLSSSKKDIKLLITPGMHFWSCSISFPEIFQESNSVSALPSCQSNDKMNEELNKLDTDIDISMPSCFKNDVNFDTEVWECFGRQYHLLEGENGTLNCKQGRINTSCPSSEMSHIDQVLPTGNLISLHGLVTGVHDGNDDSFSAQAGHFNALPQPVLLQGKSSICIHVATDNRDVKISGHSYKGAFPADIRIGVRASFHRILELNGQNVYMLIPASFIDINSSSPLDKHSVDGNCYTSPEAVVPFVANSEILHTENQPLQLHCRVLAVYILVLEKTRKSTSCETESFVDIVLAGFVLDTGASSYCCWANHERAAALLKLHVEKCQFASKQSGEKEGCGSAIHRLHTIVQEYGRIIVKNVGSVHDSLCHDLTISVSSGKTITFSDENILRHLILNSCFSTIQTVVGSLMDDITMKQLEKYLAECQMNILPLQNIWATGVHQMNPLSEARSIYQGLISTS